MNYYRCRVCGVSKPEIDFYVSHITRCKVCYRKKQTQYYDKMTDEQWKAHCRATKSNSKGYYAKHRDLVRKKLSEYYYAHRDVLKQKSRERYYKNKKLKGEQNVKE
jgi:DNA polymerase III delta prime subunit